MADRMKTKSVYLKVFFFFYKIDQVKEIDFFFKKRVKFSFLFY